ncbi:hypothetical protein A3B02_00985 [Candidatus Roizmanbacteria bacterium RIFCSPLOWO2_01_FULL_42_14]|uniref:Homing endonuclease LAGLIDADG domain-containing protein n=3 Tax=Candidatus Roizmaniibacteriota TaxID=1752723 RepID=A0A1F7JXC0_9BACT|nr:MAG: hypothetical protein A3D08_02815 [Candidatus Roizmanbacteria bacterium RIFCSPHIGHO2_02_FULL_43_11]OGK52568.1 MAG: hypothetical protein A3B02_00985 [Candidatus Roizmanbacteria bacterium RIFCSPLOWO2_01_FULL_42_14]OGK60244.1 MAG: hypothetical protein A3I56_01615 [Candidatus Roizmanbacteria bacterium RIFCSPLOWO2_02_FULL_43_10]
MVNTVGKNCSEADKAYIAGFLDADGAIMAHVERNSELIYKFRVRVSIALYQSQNAVIEWMYKKLETGSVTKQRNLYKWNTTDQNAVRVILTVLKPYLRVKKKQAELALSIMNTPICSKRKLLYVATLADALCSLNVRSQNSGMKNVTMIKEYFSCND